MKTILITLATTCCVSACGSNVDVGGFAALAAAGSGGTGESSGSPAAAGSGGAAGGSNLAACAVPAGTAATLDTTAKFYAAIVGRWLICPGGLSAFGEAPANVIGVEYEAPTTTTDLDGLLWGNMYYLVDSPDGVVRGAGFDYQLTYDVSPQDPAEGPPVQFNMHPTPNSGFAYGFTYSPSPRQWYLHDGSPNHEASGTLVPAN